MPAPARVHLCVPPAAKHLEALKIPKFARKDAQVSRIPTMTLAEERVDSCGHFKISNMSRKTALVRILISRTNFKAHVRGTRQTMQRAFRFLTITDLFGGGVTLGATYFKRVVPARATI